MSSFSLSAGAAISFETTRPADLDARVVVWASWLSLSGAALYFVAQYAYNMPFWDEFDSLVPWVTHDQPVTFRYLWSQANEHRLPLPKLVLLGLAKVTGTDFRAGMYATVLLMSVLSAGMIMVARGLRGSTSYADAGLPLLLSHWGHWENYMMGFLVAFALATFWYGTALALIVNRGAWGIVPEGQFRFWPALLAGLCLILMTLCGAQGIIGAAPLALWLGYVSVRSLLSRRGRDGRAIFVLLCSLTVGCVIAAYFLTGYTAPTPLCPELEQSLIASGQFLLVGFGVAARECWPFGIIVLALGTIIVLGALAWNWKNRASERLAIAGMGAFLLGGVLLAFAIGRGRGAMPPGGFSARYGLMSVPFVLALYLAALRWAAPAGTRLVQYGIVFLAIVLAQTNFSDGQRNGQARHEQYQMLRAALRAGKSPQEITALCSQYFHHSPTMFHNGLKLLRQAHVGPYADVLQR